MKGWVYLQSLVCLAGIQLSSISHTAVLVLKVALAERQLAIGEATPQRRFQNACCASL